MPIRRPIALSILCTVLVAGCGLTQPRQQLPAAASTIDKRVVHANNQFAFQLMRKLHEKEPQKNLFISPASVHLALSLAANGARGETQQAITRTLFPAGMSMEEVNRENGLLRTILDNPDSNVELHIANSIWYQKGFKVTADFQDLATKHYAAQIQAVDFPAKSAAETINRWVANATNQTIKSIVDRTDNGHRMFLINAIYFNGKWKKPFDPDRTQPMPFKSTDGSTKQVSMMSQGGHYRYLKGDHFAAAALPYGDGRLNLYLFLPDTGVSLKQWVAGLTADRWDEWMGSFAEREGDVTLPKLKVSYDADLKPALSGLGMGLPFEPKADFGGLFRDSPESLAITSVRHKTYVDMNEKGTEAAAVTAVGVSATTSVPAPNSRFNLVVDRPYVMVVRDDKTGAMLFAGLIYDPRYSEL